MVRTKCRSSEPDLAQYGHMQNQLRLMHILITKCLDFISFRLKAPEYEPWFYLRNIIKSHLEFCISNPILQAYPPYKPHQPGTVMEAGEVFTRVKSYSRTALDTFHGSGTNLLPARSSRGTRKKQTRVQALTVNGADLVRRLELIHDISDQILREKLPVP